MGDDKPTFRRGVPSEQAPPPPPPPGSDGRAIIIKPPKPAPGTGGKGGIRTRITVTVGGVTTEGPFEGETIRQAQLRRGGGGGFSGTPGTKAVQVTPEERITEEVLEGGVIKKTVEKRQLLQKTLRETPVQQMQSVDVKQEQISKFEEMVESPFGKASRPKFKLREVKVSTPKPIIQMEEQVAARARAGLQTKDIQQTVPKVEVIDTTPQPIIGEVSKEVLERPPDISKDIFGRTYAGFVQIPKTIGKGTQEIFTTAFKIGQEARDIVDVKTIGTQPVFIPQSKEFRKQAVRRIGLLAKETAMKPEVQTVGALLGLTAAPTILQLGAGAAFGARETEEFLRGPTPEQVGRLAFLGATLIGGRAIGKEVKRKVATAQLKKEFQGKLIVREDLFPEVIRRDISVDVLGREVKGIRGRRLVAGGPEGVVGKGKIELVLGKRGPIDFSQQPTEYVFVAGKKGTVVKLIGKARDTTLPSTKIGRQDLIISEEPVGQIVKRQQIVDLLSGKRFETGVKGEGLFIRESFPQDTGTVLTETFVSPKGVKQSFVSTQTVDTFVSPLDLSRTKDIIPIKPRGKASPPPKQQALIGDTSGVFLIESIKAVPKSQRGTIFAFPEIKEAQAAREQTISDIMAGDVKLTPTARKDIRKTIRKEIVKEVGKQEPVGPLAEELPLFEPKSFFKVKKKEVLGTAREATLTEARAGDITPTLLTPSKIRKEFRKGIVSREGKVPSSIDLLRPRPDKIKPIFPSARQSRRAIRKDILARRGVSPEKIPTGFFDRPIVSEPKEVRILRKKESRQEAARRAREQLISEVEAGAIKIGELRPSIRKIIRKDIVGKRSISPLVIPRKGKGLILMDIEKLPKRLIERKDGLIRVTEIATGKVLFEAIKERKKPKPFIETKKKKPKKKPTLKSDEPTTKGGQVLILEPPITKTKAIGGQRGPDIRIVTPTRAEAFPSEMIGEEFFFSDLARQKIREVTGLRQERVTPPLTGSRVSPSAAIKPDIGLDIRIPPKIKTELGIIALPVPKVAQAAREQPKIKTIVDVDTQQKLRLQSKQRQEIIAKQDVAQRQDILSLQDVGQIQEVVQKQDILSRLSSKQTSKLIPKQTINLTPRLPPPPTPPTTTTFFPKPKPLRKKPTKAEVNKVQGYHPEIKKRLEKIGKKKFKGRGYKRASKKAMTYAQAFNKGARLTDKFANRSFRVRKAKTKVKPSRERINAALRRKFRSSKAKKNIFVEKSRFAIDSPQEKRDITYEGIKARKRQARKTLLQGGRLKGGNKWF